jgi:predicted metal-dependent hydrolase
VAQLIDQALPLLTRSALRAQGAAVATVDVLDECLPLEVRVRPQARRYVLRLGADRVVRLTLPKRGSLKEAEVFLRRSQAWLERRLEQVRSSDGPPSVWKDGTEILLRGVWVRLSQAPGGVQAGDVLVPPSDERNWRPAVEAALRCVADEELPPRVEELARREHLVVRRVSVRNQRTRWGSCSRSGNMSLNWRLIQVPPDVRDYVVLHELMHLREMNHSSRFWAHVAVACPLYRHHAAWLRAHAGQLGMA